MPTAEFGEFTQADALEELIGVVVEWVEQNLSTGEILNMSKTEAHLIATKIVVDGYVAVKTEGSEELWCLLAESIVEKSKHGMRTRANALITEIQRRSWNAIMGFRMGMAA